MWLRQDGRVWRIVHLHTATPSGKQGAVSTPRKRPIASARGYDSRWEQARREYLADHPRCQHPGCNAYCANVVDHVIIRTVATYYAALLGSKKLAGPLHRSPQRRASSERNDNDAEVAQIQGRMAYVLRGLPGLPGICASTIRYRLQNNVPIDQPLNVGRGRQPKRLGFRGRASDGQRDCRTCRRADAEERLPQQ